MWIQVHQVSYIAGTFELSYALKRSFAALPPSIFLPFNNILIWPHLEYDIQATHPILSLDAEALEKMHKLALKFVKGLRHVPSNDKVKHSDSR